MACGFMDAGSGGVAFGDTEDLAWAPDQVIATLLATSWEKTLTAVSPYSLQRVKYVPDAKRHNQSGPVTPDAVSPYVLIR
jgi:hypothetical protein